MQHGIPQILAAMDLALMGWKLVWQEEMEFKVCSNFGFLPVELCLCVSGSSELGVSHQHAHTHTLLAFSAFVQFHPQTEHF